MRREMGLYVMTKARRMVRTMRMSRRARMKIWLQGITKWLKKFNMSARYVLFFFYDF